VIALIEARFGTVCSKAGVIKLLHRLDFDYAQPKGLPAKADAAAREAFVATYERLMNGLLPDEAVYFSDAVHPEYQSRPAHGWLRCGDRLAVKKGKGRQRLNLMGALNLETFDLRLVETVKMSTQTTIELLARLERHNPDKRAIHVILDRAPVHRGEAVRAWLARPGCRIKLHFLPAYAPNLNAIERLWQLMHEHVTHNRYHDTFRKLEILPRHRQRQFPHRQTRTVSGCRVDGVRLSPCTTSSQRQTYLPATLADPPRRPPPGTGPAPRAYPSDR
jgi:transposase